MSLGKPAYLCDLMSLHRSVCVLIALSTNIRWTMLVLTTWLTVIHSLSPLVKSGTVFHDLLGY